MSRPTELPIHEVILKIMYNADREKPMGLTTADVLWKIDNPEITERYIKEILDWLVREKKAELYLNKYNLERHEFLEQKAKSEEEDVIVSTTKETFYIKPAKKKNKNVRRTLVFSIGVLALCYVTYMYGTMKREYETPTELPTYETLVNEQLPTKKMFLSTSSQATVNKQMEDISYSFYKQNTNNDNLQKEITRLYKLTDSLQKVQQSNVGAIQKQLDRNINANINKTNEILHIIIVCNIIFLLVIAFVFFKDYL